MDEDLFASNPRSYKIDRRSPEAFELRDAVNGKLFDFLGNYNDEVLAEYIVVLVCNGKNQIQARDDLEAFLGDDSGSFVAWLWDHIAKASYISRTPMVSSSFKAEVTSSHEDILNKEQKSSCLPDLHTHSSRMSDSPLAVNNILQPKDGRYSSYCSANSNSSKVIEIPERLQRWCPSINGSLTEDNSKRLQAHLDVVNSERLQAESTVANEHSAAAYHTGATKQFSSIVRCSPEFSSDDEQLHNEYQHRKIAKIDSSAFLPRPLPVPRTEQPARGLRSTITEDRQSRPLPIRNSAKIRLQAADVDSTPHHIARPRGNVWDRLGKPCNEDDAEMRGKNNLHDNSPIKRDLLDSQGEEIQNPGAMWIKQNARLRVGESVGLGNSYCNVKSKDQPSECRKLEHSSNNIVEHPCVNNSTWKSLYSECNSGSFSGRKENHLQVKEVPPKTQDSFPVKYNQMQNLEKVASEAKSSTMSVSKSTCNAVIFARVQQNSQGDKIDSVIPASVVRNSQTDKASPQLNKSASVTTQAHKLVPKKSQLPCKSESPRKAECHIANLRLVKDEVLDVKPKLCQMETDVLKLRKQEELRNDAKPNSLTGVQNHSEEDIESRTVLVTNVHFAAPREALLSHFTKCGSVAKVVMLTDTITAQPKGAAYIVFANKDSVDKAVSMSGTSFFSRILTVIRKADMLPDFLVPSQSPAKLMQPFYPQPFWKGAGHYSSTHLQWRRENPANRENSVSATTNGLESSATGE